MSPLLLDSHADEVEVEEEDEREPVHGGARRDDDEEDEEDGKGFWVLHFLGLNFLRFGAVVFHLRFVFVRVL